MGRNKRGIEKGKRIVALALTSVLLLASFDGSYSAVADDIFGSGPMDGNTVDDVFGDNTSNTEFTSDTAADPVQNQDETLTTEQVLESTEVPSGPVAITYSDLSMNVTVTEKTEGTFPDGAQLSVVPVSGDDAEYIAVLEKLQIEAGTREHEVKSLWAYELSASDVQGAEIALETVDVEVEYASPEAPEVIAEDTEVRIYTYSWDEAQNEAELFEVNADILLTDAKAVQTAKMQLNNPENIIFEWETKAAQETENVTEQDTAASDGEESADLNEENVNIEETIETDVEESDEETSDEETADEETTDEETADEETSDEETADEETSDEETADEETSDEETADEETSDEETADEETLDEETTDEETLDEETSEAYKESRNLKEDAAENAAIKIVAEKTPVYAVEESEEVQHEEAGEATPESTEEVQEEAGEESLEVTEEEIPESTEVAEESTEQSKENTSETVSTEVIGTAYTEDTFDLVETIKDEEGNPIWYGIVYDADEAVKGYVFADAAELYEKEETQNLKNLEIKTDDGVTVIVTEEEEGAIPENAKLQVIPIKEDQDPKKYAQVTKQLENAAEEQPYDIVGFLAYDISFVDENGDKIEPDGEVRVSLNYNEAAAPESVSEEEIAVADVTVFHLEEDNRGRVRDVVDMAEAEKVETVQTTEEENKIETVELCTDSFSVYTVTWINNGRYLDVVTYYGYVNNKGEFVEFEDGVEAVNPVPGNTTWINPQNKGIDAYKTVKKGNIADYAAAQNYVYSGAYIIKETEENAAKKFVDKKVRIKGLALATTGDGGAGDYYVRYYDESGNSKPCGNDYYYKDNAGNALKGETNRKSLAVYFVYDTPLTKINTVNHEALGITLSMKDLVGVPTNNQERHDTIGENLNSLIKIGGSYKDKGTGNIKFGLVEDKLNSEGYPVTTGKYQGGEKGKNLKSLFAGGTKANHLFSESTYEETGYLEYSSFENYAYLNGNNFDVYNQIGTPNNKNYFFYQRGNFMPYNKIEAGKFSTNLNMYDSDGVALSDGASRKGERLYKTQGENYYFGMYMETDFLQPQGGMVTPPKGSNKQPMKYEFNGDDDMWIFIDGVLVLDIGGIHDAHSGYIDFSTGNVVIKDGESDNAGNPPTGEEIEKVEFTLKDCFIKAGCYNDEDFKDNTFKDYTMHEFKMFYMERGEGASNLHMKLNLQTIPKNAIEVAKILEDTDKENYEQKDFSFEVYVQEKTEESTNDNPVYSENKYEVLTPERMEKEGITARLKTIQGDLKMDKDGTFRLKAGQSAIFENISINRKYYVREKDINTDEYDAVTIVSTPINQRMQNGDSIQTVTGTEQLNPYIYADSSKETVGKRPVVTFKNKCNQNYLNELKITKKMKEGQSALSGDDTFNFKISLTNQSGALVPYAKGPYYLQDKAGNYYYLDEAGNLINNRTNSKKCGDTSEGGVVTGVPVGYTVTITQLTAGTGFKVEEVGLNPDHYLTPTITVTNADTENLSDELQGKIQRGEPAQVTVTNRLNNKWQIIKRSTSENPDTGAHQPLDGAVFELTEKTSNSVWYTGTSDEQGVVHWEIKQNNDLNDITKASQPEKVVLKAGTYIMKEVTAPLGYALSQTEWTITIDENGMATNIVSSDDNIEDDHKSGTLLYTYYFSNTPVYDLPSTGGTGIYGFTLGGALLMMAAALMLFQNRCKVAAKK